MPINTIGAGSAGGEAGMDLLFGTTLTVDTASIDTGTLATGYRDLMIFVSGRSDAAGSVDSLYIHYNGDTTASNYEGRRRLTGDAGVFDVDTTIHAGDIVAAVTASSRPSSNVIHVLDHEGTTLFKAYSARSGNIASNTFRTQQIFSSVWLSTAAITSVQFSLATGDFVAGTTVSVYGVK